MVLAHQIKVIFLLFLSCTILVAAESGSAADINVLILHSYDQEYPWTKKENEGIVTTLRTKLADKELTIFTEYLDTKRVLFTDEYQAFFNYYLERKYNNRSPDILFLTDDNAVKFWLRFKEKLFPGVNTVFCGVNDTSIKEILRDSTICGVFEVKDIPANLRLIRRLFPGVRKISVVGDNSPTYQAIHQNLHSLPEDLLPSVSLQYAADSAMSRALEKIKSQNPEIVLLTTIGAFHDDDGHTLPLSQAIKRIRQAGDYAIIGMEDAYIEQGVFGGIVTSGQEQGRAAAEKGYKLITGTPPEKDQQQFDNGPNLPIFNYRELKRLDIRFEFLPDDAIILGRPLSLYEEFKEIVLANMIAIALLLTLIFLLSWSIVRRKKSEANLLASEYFLSSVLDNLPDIVFVKDAETLRFVRLNKTAERYFGRSAEEIVGKSDYDFFPPDEADFFTKKDKETLEKQIQVNIPLERIQTPEGRRYLNTKKIPILGNKNQSQYLLGISRDITEEINAAKSRKDLEDKLQQAQKMEAIGTLAGGIAHDFNNILSSVIGYTELAQHKADDPDEVRSLLQGTLKGAERAKLLIRQILTFSRKDEQQQRPLWFADLLKDAVSLLRSTLPSSITIEEKITGRAAVLANSTQIHQIIMNLGTNGYQAMADSSGTLTFSLDEVELESSLPEMKAGKYAHLSIEDTGSGMSAETQERMFEPYFTTKGSTSGTGLGLAVVHGIVKSHGGHISVSSEEGIGTKIEIYLPLFEGDVEDLSETGRDGDIVGGDESLLIVDDEPDITKMMEKYLAIFGYQVRAFTGSPEALAEYEKNYLKYDLVITDMTMPEMTGAELAVKMLEINPDLPIILCTGHSDDIDRKRAIALGISTYYEKPVTIDGLLSRIRELLDS